VHHLQLSPGAARRCPCRRRKVNHIKHFLMTPRTLTTHSSTTASTGSADTVRTRTMTHAKLNEDTIKRLPVPASGNRVTYFAGATIQGVKAPRGFGVRVTAAGARAFVLNYRLRAREYRFTIGAWPDWSALKAVREARHLRQARRPGREPARRSSPPACNQGCLHCSRRVHHTVCPQQGKAVT